MSSEVNGILVRVNSESITLAITTVNRPRSINRATISSITSSTSLDSVFDR